MWWPDVQVGGTLSDAVLSGSHYLLTQFVWHEGGTLSQNGNSETTLNTAQEIIASAVLTRLAIAHGEIAVEGANRVVYWGAGGDGTSNVSILGYGGRHVGLGYELYLTAGGAADTQNPGLDVVPNIDGALNSALENTLSSVLSTDLGDPTRDLPGRVPVTLLDGSVDYVTPQCEAVISAWQATSTVYTSGGLTIGGSLVTSWKSAGGSNPDPARLINAGTIGGTTFFGFPGYMFGQYPYPPYIPKRPPGGGR